MLWLFNTPASGWVDKVKPNLGLLRRHLLECSNDSGILAIAIHDALEQIGRSIECAHEFGNTIASATRQTSRILATDNLSNDEIEA